MEMLRISKFDLERTTTKLTDFAFRRKRANTAWDRFVLIAALSYYKSQNLSSDCQNT